MNRTILILAAALSLAACEQSVKADPNGNPQEQLEARAQSGDPVAIAQRNDQRIAQNVSNHLSWTDPVTGCDYVAPGQSNSYGSMPRMDRDGYHVYCADQKERDRLIAAGEPVPEGLGQ